MLVTRINDVKEAINQDFAAASDVAAACFAIINHIEKHAEDQLGHLTYGMLKKIAGHETQEEVISRAIAYLAGDVACILKIRFEFIDGDLIYPITPNEIIQARSNGYICHPGTGEEIQEFEPNIYIYFVPFGFSEDSELL